MDSEDRFWLSIWTIALLAFAVLMVAAANESTKTAALCKQAIEQKADFAIAKLCR